MQSSFRVSFAIMFLASLAQASMNLTGSMTADEKPVRANITNEDCKAKISSKVQGVIRQFCEKRCLDNPILEGGLLADGVKVPAENPQLPYSLTLFSGEVLRTAFGSMYVETSVSCRTGELRAFLSNDLIASEKGNEDRRGSIVSKVSGQKNIQLSFDKKNSKLKIQVKGLLLLNTQNEDRTKALEEKLNSIANYSTVSFQYEIKFDTKTDTLTKLPPDQSGYRTTDYDFNLPSSSYIDFAITTGGKTNKYPAAMNSEQAGLYQVAQALFDFQTEKLDWSRLDRFTGELALLNRSSQTANSLNFYEYKRDYLRGNSAQSVYKVVPQ